jgi:hypothetical protein
VVRLTLVAVLPVTVPRPYGTMVIDDRPGVSPWRGALAASLALLVLSTCVAAGVLAIHSPAADPAVGARTAVEPGSPGIAVMSGGPGRLATALAAPSRIGWRAAHVSSYGIGDGHIGERLACGGHLTPTVRAVAHRTLPCGTRVELLLGTRSVVARVLDRGPFVPGIGFYLAPAVCAALRNCSGDVVISWRLRQP